jgi:hypothetical protein
MDVIEEIDLFEQYETLPQEVQDVLMKYCDGDNSYKKCRALIKALKPHGYTCEYGLDGQPYGLKQIEGLTTYQMFIAWKASDNVIRTEKKVYLTQCSQYGIPMNRKELYKYFKKEFGYNK